MKKILAIGCGGAGMFSLIVASQLKKEKFETTVLSDEEDIYCRCTTPYILTKEAEVEDAIQPESMVGDYGVKIVHDKATKLNTNKKEVIGESGKIYHYDYLVIATGASPYRPDIDGINLPGVHTVRNSIDIKNIQTLAKSAKKAVVIGAGVIGIEMAGALRFNNIETTLVEMSCEISPHWIDPEYNKMLNEHLKNNKVDVMFDSCVKSIQASEGNKKIIKIDKKGSEVEIEADLVIVASGVRPNLEIISGTNIKAKKQGIIVDRKMQTSVKDVFACGDCIIPVSAIDGKPTISQLASTAIQQSKIVGFQIAGFPIKYGGTTGAFAFQTMGKEFACVGLTEQDARKKFKWVITGTAETTDIYKDLKTCKPLNIKLIFAGPKMRLVGFQAFGNGVISSAEVASLAIGDRMSIMKVLKFNYIAHPSLTAWPFMNPIIMATEDAMGNLMKKIPFLKGN